MTEQTLHLTVDTSPLGKALGDVQRMIDDGTLDRAADQIVARQESDRRAAIDAALAGPPGGDYNAGLQIVIYRDGSFVVEQPGHVWELQSDPDYFCTISLAAITVAVAQVLN